MRKNNLDKDQLLTQNEMPKKKSNNLQISKHSKSGLNSPQYHSQKDSSVLGISQGVSYTMTNDEKLDDSSIKVRIQKKGSHQPDNRSSRPLISKHYSKSGSSSPKQSHSLKDTSRLVITSSANNIQSDDKISDDSYIINDRIQTKGSYHPNNKSHDILNNLQISKHHSRSGSSSPKQSHSFKYSSGLDISTSIIFISSSDDETSGDISTSIILKGSPLPDDGSSEFILEKMKKEFKKLFNLLEEESSPENDSY